MRRILALWIVVVAVTPQTPPPATALVVGRVIDAGSGQPIGGALVTLRISAPPAPVVPGQRPSPNPPPRRAMTEPGGGFVFTNVPPGRHELTSTKGGYAEGGFGRKRPDGAMVSFDVTDGARVGGVTIKMWKFGAVAGIVTDEVGDPVVGVIVHALMKRFNAGRLRLVRGANATTDDRGAYRIGNLLPGDYVVAVPSTATTLPAPIVDEYFRDPEGSGLRTTFFSVTSLMSPPGSPESERIGDLVLQGSSRSLSAGPVAADGRLAVYPTLFYPGALSSGQATVIALGSGETRGGLDIRIRAVPAVRVSGTLKGPDGPVPLQAVRLAARSVADDIGPDNTFDAAVSMTDRRGTFTFLGVPAGQYVLKATRTPRPAGRGAPAPSGPPEPALWAIETVAVGTRDVAIDVTLNLALRVSGTFVFEGSTPPQLARPLAVTLEAADGRGQFTSQSQPSNTTSFTASGLPGGRYLLHMPNAPPPGWIMKSATLDGKDVAESAFDVKADVSGVVVTFTEKFSRVSGTVRNAQGGPAADTLVLAFPADPAGWVDFGMSPRRIKNAQVDSTGAYAFSGLPDGEYLIAAVTEESVTEPRSPKMFDALSRLATHVSISNGGQVTQDLRLVVVR